MAAALLRISRISRVCRICCICCICCIFFICCIYALPGCRAVPDRASKRPSTDRPNIIVIFTDDQGYADVGCQGAVGFATPHIDAMAAQGMRFTDFYVAAAACSPSRAALLTGCYPQRVSIPAVLFPQSRIGLNPDEVTLAEILRSRGYATAAVGKWHLGHHPPFLPTNHGFDQWLGLPYSNDMTPDASKNPNPRARRHPPLPLMRGTEVIATEPDQSKLTQQYTEEALQFIRKQAQRPFFLYLAHTFPHVPLFAGERFAGKTKRGLYGDVIEEIDWSVGELLSELDRQGIADNTLVVFTSDNGPWLVKGAHGGSAKPLREGKATSFEGGHRVPCVIRWPAKIPAGQVCRTMVTAMDLLPTITALCGGTLPQDRNIDGRDVSALLRGGTLPGAAEHPFFYYRGRQLQAVRVGRYKLHLPHSYGSIDGARLADATFPGRLRRRRIELSLFDLEADIGETTNVAPEHPDVVQRLLALCEQARADLGDGRQRKGTGVRPPGCVQ
ncbi:MAG: sulfatase family protein [Planctomycetota bacterium]|jgi:arylsulfatase A-like enzyme